MGYLCLYVLGFYGRSYSTMYRYRFVGVVNRNGGHFNNERESNCERGVSETQSNCEIGVSERESNCEIGVSETQSNYEISYNEREVSERESNELSHNESEVNEISHNEREELEIQSNENIYKQTLLKYTYTFLLSNSLIPVFITYIYLFNMFADIYELVYGCISIYYCYISILNGRQRFLGSKKLFGFRCLMVCFFCVKVMKIKFFIYCLFGK
ncbi:hypothetical protein NAPIS_ORF01581 [Vairimorpha apis BRL 01]|uniref:Uncharacterized protein n=1 Tax=Vairimorpha apis BRL 01 TaxID=1037528 RepID=T0MIN1_9MICR|nr:hypothetical protein NAPIS_ORF01581 [Vairimorpha apis BRL 01]